MTSGALLVMHAVDAHPSRVVELAVLIVASACATVTRFVALRSWVFARRARRALTPAVTAIARKPSSAPTYAVRAAVSFAGVFASGADEVTQEPRAVGERA